MTQEIKTEYCDERYTMAPQTNTDPPLRLLMAFHQTFDGASPEWILQAPGREMWVAATAATADYTIHAPDLEQRTTFSWRSARQKHTVLKRPLPKWARFPAGVIVPLTAKGMDAPGIKAVFVGEESGPRYDYAAGVAFAALWHHITDAHYTSSSLIDVVEAARRDYVDK